MCVARNPPWATRCPCVSCISTHSFTQAEGGDAGVPSTSQALGSLRTACTAKLGCSPVWHRRARTYRVVSWLMLVKEELFRELILLLLRSLENRNPRAWSQLGPIPSHCSPACSAAMGCKQQQSTASKGGAGLSHRVMAAMPLVPLCSMPGGEQPEAEHRCQTAVFQSKEGTQRDVRGPRTLPGPSSGSHTTETAPALPKFQQCLQLPGLLVLATYTSCRYLKVESCPGT